MQNSVTTAEAALRLGMSRERVIRLLYSGGLRGECVAGRWLVDAKSVDEFQASSAQHPVAAGSGQ